MEEIKSHPFFEDLDWVKMRSVKSPYIPELTSEDDCRRFDKFDEEEPFHPVDDKKNNPKKQRKDVNFPGYTFKKDVEEQKTNFVRALNESLQTDITGGSTNMSYDNGLSGGGTPNSQIKSTSDTSQNSNYYTPVMQQPMQQQQQQELTMLSNSNVSKNS